MDSSDSTRKPTTAQSGAAAKKQGKQGACQICGKSGGVVFDPEKAPPNRLCYRCAAEYGMQDSDEY